MFLKLQSHPQMLDSDKSDKHNSLLCYRVNYGIKNQIKHEAVFLVMCEPSMNEL
jgi:hypothetical protein